MITLKLKAGRKIPARHEHPENMVVPPRWLGGLGARERLSRMQQELDEIARHILPSE